MQKTHMKQWLKHLQKKIPCLTNLEADSLKGDLILVYGEKMP